MSWFGPVGESWHALAREAALSAEHIAIGITALGKANISHLGFYSQAFFALSVGFERSAKLAIVVDYSQQNYGEWPKQAAYRKYGHDIQRLLTAVELIAAERWPEKKLSLPKTQIHTEILRVLTEFSTNITRYYNLDFLSSMELSKPGAVKEPIADWHESVNKPVLRRHYMVRTRERHFREAKVIDESLGYMTLVQQQTEIGEDIDSLGKLAQKHAEARSNAPWVRMYTLQIARFIYEVMSELTDEAYDGDLEPIPDLTEFYSDFGVPDKNLRSRKSWSIYRR